MGGAESWGGGGGGADELREGGAGGKGSDLWVRESLCTVTCHPVSLLSTCVCMYVHVVYQHCPPFLSLQQIYAMCDIAQFLLGGKVQPGVCQSHS